MTRPAPYSFAGRTAVLTGAASGIGEHLAYELAARGSDLVLVDVDGRRLDAVAGQIRAAHPGRAVTAIAANLAERAEVDSLIAQVLAEHPVLGLLVNNAGISLAGRFDQVTVAQFETVMNVNFRAPLLLSHAFLPALVAAPGSHVVNVSSVLGLVGLAGQSAYSSSKFALRALSQVLHSELGDVGVGVTTVYPGGIRTRIAVNALVGEGVPVHEALSRGRSVSALLTYPPEKAARQILDAVVRRKPRLLIAASAKVPDALARLMPVGHTSLMRKLHALRRGPGHDTSRGPSRDPALETDETAPLSAAPPVQVPPALGRDDISGLERAVRGSVLLPDDPGFAAECATYNLLNPLRPALAVGASCVADVQAAVRFAGSRAMPVAVSATGHQVRQPAEGAVLISLRRLTGATVDVDRRRVRIAGGTRWQQVVDAATAHGLAPVNGSSLTVGAVGYLLGGGLSPTLGRTRGYGADTVRAVEIVTADGQVRQVTADSEPDLFFAVRGGKGNFGVVTAVEADLFEVRRLYGGAIYFAGEHAPEVLHTWRRWAVGLPAQLTTSIAIQRLPTDPALPEPIRGSFVVAVRIAYLGPAAEGRGLVAELRAAAPVLLDGVADMPYADVGTIHSDPAEPLPYVDRTTGLRTFPAEAVDALLEVVGPGSDCPLVSVEVRALGGALDRQAEVPNSVSPRGLPFVLFGFGVGSTDQSVGLITYLAKVISAMQPWADERCVPNFLSADEATTPDAVRFVYGSELYDRLAQIKAHWDPDNLFRINHNIPPAALMTRRHASVSTPFPPHPA